MREVEHDVQAAALTPMVPIRLPSNQPTGRFYEGGRQISDFRSEPPAEPRTPEDWIGSTTSVRGNAPIGMTWLPDGRLLADAIAEDPVSWLGTDHVERFGGDTMLLVKLLDAGQRLPIHAHPDGQFAAAHLAATHGKAEAWYILEPGSVFLGLTSDIDRAEILRLVEAQDTAELLSRMHRLTVSRHDTVFVPHGLLHAIGPGVLLAEVQEPEDLSILLEWTGFDLDGETHGHLGLGFDLALKAVETTSRSEHDIAALVDRAGGNGPALVSASEPFFRLDRVRHDAVLDAGLSILIALEGAMRLTMTFGASEELRAGTTVLIPYSAGVAHLTGSGTVLVARPPRP